jgi:hypothetical protein
MATKPTKAPGKVAAKANAEPKAAPKKKTATPKAKPSSVVSIEKAAEDALKKLQALKIEVSLQADIEWCLGSYRNDKNPSGLYTMVGHALSVLTAAAQKNTKAVSAKLLADLSKALKNQ